MYVSDNKVSVIRAEKFNIVYQGLAHQYFKEQSVTFTFVEIMEILFLLFNGVIDDEAYSLNMDKLATIDQTDEMSNFSIDFLHHCEDIVRVVIPEFIYYPIPHLYFALEGNLVYILDRRKKIYVPDVLRNTVSSGNHVDVFTDLGW